MGRGHVTHRSRGSALSALSCSQKRVPPGHVMGPCQSGESQSVTMPTRELLPRPWASSGPGLFAMGTIYLFRKTQRSLLGKLTQEFRVVTADRRSWKILLFGAINVICTGFLLTWCSSTNSMGT
ncbi:hypothetical protein FKM82_023165 [Ascaphus truei]